jgi:multiple sugar transport system substrate-binding protein
MSRRISAWLSLSLCIAGLLTASAGAGQTKRLVFLSTQLRPIEEAQKMRNVILENFPREVDYFTEDHHHHECCLHSGFCHPTSA